MSSIDMLKIGFDSFLGTLRDRWNEQSRVWTLSNILEVVVNFAIFAFLSKLLYKEAYVYLNFFALNFMGTRLASIGREFVSFVCQGRGKGAVRTLIPLRRTLAPVYIWAFLIEGFDAGWAVALAFLILIAFGGSLGTSINDLPSILLIVLGYGVFLALIEMSFQPIHARSQGVASALGNTFTLFHNFISGVYFPIAEFKKVSEPLFHLSSVYPGFLFLQAFREAAYGAVSPQLLIPSMATAFLGVLALKWAMGKYWKYVVNNDLWEWRP